MNLLQKKKDKKGFTLIEVVIVLAIAALILVIVFLAVQGAQKSQRDNAAKQGASRAIAATQNFISDIGGSPTAAQLFTVAAASSNRDLDGSPASGDFGKYFTGVVGHGGKAFWLGNAPVNSINDHPRVTFGQVCNGGIMVPSGSYTNVAAVYWSESANKSVCISS